MAISAARAAQILDSGLHALSTLPALTAPLRLRIMTANGTGTTAGTEVATGGGYTAGTGAPSVTFGAASAASHPASSATSSAVNITNYPRAETVVGVETYDSQATPQRQEYGALTSAKTMAAGDTLSFGVGSITSTLG